MRAVFAVVCLAVAAQAASLYQDEWQAYKAQYGKKYEAAEDAVRYQSFVRNLKEVEEHNRLHAAGLTSFTRHMNHFADMLEHELTSGVMKGFRMSARGPKVRTRPTGGAPRRGLLGAQATGGDLSDDGLPAEVDWRTQGVVTPVKDQGQCGSCWAFSATGALEAHYAIKTGHLVSLSEQNLVDCSGYTGNAGCEGGIMTLAFDYVRWNNGIDSEESYPYKAKNDFCHFNSSNVVTSDSGFMDIKIGDEQALKDALATVGPVAVAMDANHMSFMTYSKGVFEDRACSSSNLDHGVLVVGYGTEEGKDYWLVKNSWGTSWGDEGYFKLARNHLNMCGIVTEASYPLI